MAVVLDTYGDHRTRYFFRVNADGARVEGPVAGPEDAGLDSDGISAAATKRMARGGRAEIDSSEHTEPYQRPHGVGLQFRTQRRARPDHDDRELATLDSRFGDLSRVASLTGVDRLTQGNGIGFRPFPVGRVQTDFRESNRPWPAQPGADLTWGLTPNWPFSVIQVPRRRKWIRGSRRRRRFHCFFRSGGRFSWEARIKSSSGVG